MEYSPHSTLRNQFLLDPSVIYLNHGSFGATPSPVFESYQRWQRALENQPTEFLNRRAASLMETSRAALANYLGTSSENLAYVTNATTGLNIVARGLALRAGDEVLTTDHEYGALDRTWRFLAQKEGFTYINQPIPTPIHSTQEFIDCLWKGVSPRTRVIFISHITSPTALIFPVEEICRRAREQGILTVIDGAHVPGQIPLDLDALGADFYSGNLHKWLCAPKGSAFLYARGDWAAQIEPLIVSWGYESERPGPSRLVDYTEWQGTRDISAFLAVPEAITFQHKYDWDSVRAYCHKLTVETVQAICELTQLEPLSPLTTDWIGQMASAPLPASVDVTALHDRLYSQFRIEIPVLVWNGLKLIRCSFQGYNTPGEAQTLVAALKMCLSK